MKKMAPYGQCQIKINDIMTPVKSKQYDINFEGRVHRVPLAI